MKKVLVLFLSMFFSLPLIGCGNKATNSQIAATTRPVYEFTSYLCQKTDIRVAQIITEEISCLHNYTLQVNQMRTIENADLVVISGMGLEDFLEETLSEKHTVLDASRGITALNYEDEHNHGDEHHHVDPHIWLSPVNAKAMCYNIYLGLIENYPQHKKIFEANLIQINKKFDDLISYGNTELATLSSRDLITFHDGFSYLAKAFDLHIIHAIEEESGSEASAKELIDLIHIVNSNNLTAVFTEINGSCSGASVIAEETGVPIFQLDMVLSGEDYFQGMYSNINTLKEALK